MSVSPRPGSHVEGAAALEKALDLWVQVLAEPERSLREIAAELAIPASTSYRLVSVFESRGLIAKVGRGTYGAGPVLAQLFGVTEPNSLLMTVSRPVLKRLSARIGLTVHLGVLQDDMVTYLIKEGCVDDRLFTREGMQLEAYSSGIGKILLAHLGGARLSEYLSAGDFVKLTPNTITDPTALREELERVLREDCAFDRAEVAENLYCTAVPVRDRAGQVVAAISASAIDTPRDERMLVEELVLCAKQISARFAILGGAQPPPEAM
ncbi:IclR family transcriptional regulator [Phenylobacterium sp. SCN 70-31]|uniref:IclR family transcriptional regulator n=1 Tax=Phenylobacterium sp. SCN 70-31 TaxID=1660129 RepID=UPI0025F5DA11|nr:IclR family transcriptional regulator [Phenylobacterium sp. SCN 70-31]